MSLQYLIKDKKEAWVIAAHLLLAVLSMLSVYFFVAWFYFVLISNIGSIVNQATRSRSILLLSGYFFGLELIGRMIKASPIVPYQVGSYFMLVIFSYGAITTRSTSKNVIGKVILLLCIPGFYMIPYENYLPYFINSFSGILSLGLAATYFGNQSYTLKDLKDFLKVMVLPIIIIVVYISIKSPSYEEIDFALSANFETSGGFGTNQVSTVLGAGACFLLLAYFNQERIFVSFKVLQTVLIIAFLFRGFLTFSRGGIFGGLLAVLLSYLYMSWKVKRRMGVSIFKIVLAAAVFYVLFVFSDQITGGSLSHRYQGETAGTLSGSREKDLNLLTSNRSSLANIEWTIFTQNVFFGVGPGRGYEVRGKYFGSTIASHTELTRLLAEQGLPGLVIGFIFIFYPIIRIRRSTSTQETYYLIAFFSLAIITSFHAGMRTMITPLLWGVACASFVDTPRVVPDNIQDSEEPFDTLPG